MGCFPRFFVATTLATFAISTPIGYIMGEPKTADAPGLTNSMQQPGSWIRTRRPNRLWVHLSNDGFSNTSLAGMRLTPIASMKPSPNLASISSYGVRFSFDSLT